MGLYILFQEHSPPPPVLVKEDVVTEDVVTEDVLAEETPMPVAELQCPPSPQPHTDIDDNNNSPVKLIQDTDRETDKFVAIKSVTRSDLFRSTPDSAEISKVPAVPAVKAIDKKPKLNVWSLNLAIPPPPNFSGANHPFLTEFEQHSLRRQKLHFQEELSRLAATSQCKPQNGIPALDTSSPVVKRAKGFNGELTGLIDQQNPSLVEKLGNSSPMDVDPVSTERNENDFNKPNTPDTNVNAFKILNVIKKSPRTHLKEIIAETGLTPNGGFAPDLTAELSDSQFSDKQLKTLNRHLKNLSPSCGFKFPILDKTQSDSDHLTATVPPVLDLNVERASNMDNDKKRGQKRRHSSIDSNPKPSKSNRRNSSKKTSSASASGVEENVRRSSRSRRDVKRFEATLDNSFDGLARPASGSAESHLEPLYDVLSLRSAADGTVQYLVSWAQ